MTAPAMLLTTPQTPDQPVPSGALLDRRSRLDKLPEVFARFGVPRPDRGPPLVAPSRAGWRGDARDGSRSPGGDRRHGRAPGGRGRPAPGVRDDTARPPGAAGPAHVEPVPVPRPGPRPERPELPRPGRVRLRPCDRRRPGRPDR